MKKELGSNFWISEDFFIDKTYDEESIFRKLNLTGDSHLFSTARQAVRFVLQDISPDKKRALLPEYTCHSVIDPFLKEGYDIFYYPVDRKLRLSLSKVNRLIEKYDIGVFLFHPYFGFDSLIEDEKISSQVKVIYDATQTMYSSFDYDFYDYKVGSIRKWAEVLDGAFAEKKTGSFTKTFDFVEDDKLTSLMMEASQLKYEYMEEDRGDKKEFLRLYSAGLNAIRQAKEIFAMSSRSKLVVDNLNLEELKESRRSNFSKLLSYPNWDKIGQPVFSKLDDQVVPLYFPLHLKVDRRDFQGHLAQNDIYAPIIWSKPDIYESRQVDEDVAWIYEHTLSIPIDQRYGLDDMDRLLKVIDEYWSKK